MVRALADIARRVLPTRLWTRLKAIVRRSERTYRQGIRGFGPDQVKHALKSLGIRDGDVLMVHSGWDRLGGFRGTPKDLIDALSEVVGEKGTILMPTTPFLGSAIDHASDDPLFDARRTPSAMGLVTEVFRRGRGVVRSLHPTHSVAARGPAAEELVRDHHLAGDPCGQGTPWLRLIEFDAKILFLGVSVRANTLLHGVQAVLGPEWAELHPHIHAPLGGLTEEQYSLRTRLPDGNVHVCRTRLYDRLHVKHMKGEQVGQWLAAGRLRQSRLGGSPLTVMRARDVFEEVRRRGREGQFVLDLKSYAKDPATGHRDSVVPQGNEGDQTDAG